MVRRDQRVRRIGLLSDTHGLLRPEARAALGLAGIAIKAGARSAFATLWFVNDQSSAQLVSNFYTQLRDHPDISKAKALQAVQVKLMSDQRYAHPCYWAPYLIIGNWL